MKIKIKFRRPALSKFEIKILPLRMKYRKNLGIINHGIVKYVMLSSKNVITSINISRMCMVIESESIWGISKKIRKLFVLFVTRSTHTHPLSKIISSRSIKRKMFKRRESNRGLLLVTWWKRKRKEMLRRIFRRSSNSSKYGQMSRLMESSTIWSWGTHNIVLVYSPWSKKVLASVTIKSIWKAISHATS